MRCGQLRSALDIIRTRLGAFTTVDKQISYYLREAHIDDVQDLLGGMHFTVKKPRGENAYTAQQQLHGAREDMVVKLVAKMNSLSLTLQFVLDVKYTRTVSPRNMHVEIT